MSLKNLLAAFCCAAWAPSFAYANCLRFTPPPGSEPALSQTWSEALTAMDVAAQRASANIYTPGLANALSLDSDLAGFHPVLVTVDEAPRPGESDYEAMLRSIQQRVGTFRIVEKDDPVPARYFELINARPRPGGLCGLAPTLSGCLSPALPDAHVANYTLPAGAADAAKAVVTILIKGQNEVCNGVHLGGGRVLTNLHCAYTTAERTILFGRPFPHPFPYDRANAATRWFAPVMCSADVLWPQAGAPTMLRPDLAILELSPRVLNTGAGPRGVEVAFADTAFAGFRVTVDDPRADAWSGTVGSGLFSAQFRRTPYLEPVEKYEISFDLDLRYELAEWGNNTCRAEGPPAGRTQTPCAVDSDYANVITGEGSPHGCDALHGSSGMPLFRRNVQGAWVLTGLHRGGDGQDNTDAQLRTNWNCALRAGAISTIIAEAARIH